jgi:hypothetical protein
MKKAKNILRYREGRFCFSAAGLAMDLAMEEPWSADILLR